MTSLCCKPACVHRRYNLENVTVIERQDTSDDQPFNLVGKFEEQECNICLDKQPFVYQFCTCNIKVCKTCYIAWCETKENQFYMCTACQKKYKIDISNLQ